MEETTMQIILIIAILTAFILQGVIILGVLKMSLKWQIQAKNDILPTIDNPIKQAIGKSYLDKTQKKQKQYIDTFSEYVNGAEE